LVQWERREKIYWSDRQGRGKDEGKERRKRGELLPFSISSPLPFSLDGGKKKKRGGLTPKKKGLKKGRFLAAWRG